jgi:hypothetical protein
MANDETAGKIGPADASKSVDPVEEAHILEEHVVEKPVQVTAPASPVSAVPPTTSAATPVPATPPTSPIEPASTLGSFIPKMGDLSKMLEGIKLPTRNNEPVKETKPAQTFDTSLTIDPKSEAQDTAHKEAMRAARAITESLPNALAKSKDDVKPLHTLKDDLQNVVRDKKISLVRAVALEEEKRYRDGASETADLMVKAEKGRRTRFTLSIAGILFLLGALAIGAVLYIMTERTSGPASVEQPHILFAEQSTPFPIDTLSAADARREIANARVSGGLTLGAILQIIPVRLSGESMIPVSFGAFLDSIGANAPTELKGALADEFFFGLHTVDENAPVLIVPVRSYEHAFASMIAWEKTINQDLSPIFTFVSPQSQGPDGLVNLRTFEDVVMNNYDVRVLKDDSGVVQLYYSFPSRNILIIAESPYSFTEILSRLRADRRL